MEAATLARLKRRNRDARAACTLANSCRQVLAQHAALQDKSARQQQRLDLQEKEKHEMAADLELLQQNEANAGVSSEHIQLLQQQLELAKGEAHAEVTRLRAELGKVTASEAALRAENERLLQKLMDALALQAHAMDSEVQAHEEQRASSQAEEQRARSEAELQASAPLASLFQPAPPRPADPRPAEPAAAVEPG